jgi:hypothetical protein
MLSLDLNEQEAFFPDIESSILNLKELTPHSRLTLRVARKLDSCCGGLEVAMFFM